MVMEDALLRDRIVAGVKSVKLHDKLLQTPGLSLDKYVELGLMSEFTADQLQDNASKCSDKSQAVVDFVQTTSAWGGRPRAALPPSWKNRPVPVQTGGAGAVPCGRCGYVHRQDACPARG